GNGISLDVSGNVYIWNGNNEVMKYSNAGFPLWTNLFEAAGGLVIATDGSGNLFTSAQWWNGSSWDFRTLKYSGAGVPTWTNIYNGPGNSADSPSAIAVDGSGNVFVTGLAYFGVGSCCDYAILKYSNDGALMWVRRYNGP